MGKKDEEESEWDEKEEEEKEAEAEKETEAEMEEKEEEEEEWNKLCLRSDLRRDPEITQQRFHEFVTRCVLFLTSVAWKILYLVLIEIARSQ